MNALVAIEAVEVDRLEAVIVQNKNIVHLPLGLLGFGQIKHNALQQYADERCELFDSTPAAAESLI